MRYLALATDYDGTLAHDGRVDEATIAALVRLRETGRRLLLVTGRELPDLRSIFPRLELFDRIVAENGALIYRPATKEEKVLGSAPPAAFLEELERRGVRPLSVGRVVVATWEPHEAAVLDAIHRLGLELQVVFNKGAVMVLPSGINKATGLAIALEELGLSPHNAVGVGDAENDHAFLAHCECAVAVANALPALKERADWVTRGDHGAGVAELVEHLIADDLAALAAEMTRHGILLGKRDDGTEERIEPYGLSVLVAGMSGSGKSTLTKGLIERLAAAGYQSLIIDPEGDYAGFEGAVVLGDPQRAPLADEVLGTVDKATHNVVVNLLGVPLEQRPAFFQGLLPRLQEQRARTGRPHWLVVDEAHHLIPTNWGQASRTVPRDLGSALFITVHPESVSRVVLESVGLLLAVGGKPEQALANFAQAAGRDPPTVKPIDLQPAETLAWRPGSPPVKVKSEPPQAEHRRHSRKYAEGSVGHDRSFAFRGPAGKLNLRAHNLVLFLQMADGVDDETWLYHLKRKEYSTWFRDAIKDEELAAEAEAIEATKLSAKESRAKMREAIEKRYTLPAEKASGIT
jgi:hydroxymethylpyrimidine pyrophosphatase-like HAD family hydrolase